MTELKSLLSTPDDALVLCIRLSAVGQFVVSLQWLWHWRIFQDHQILSWSLLKKRRRFTREGFFVRLFDAVLGFPNFLLVLAVKLLVASWLILFPISATPQLYALTAVMLASLLTHLRNFPYGFTGADRMLMVVFGALWLLQLTPTELLAQQACLWFIALQAALSYATAGACKLASRDWRSREGLYHIYRNPVWVAESVADFLHKHPKVVQLSNWAGMLWQISFPLIFFVGWPLCWFFLLGALVFHLLNGYLMGLNTFVFVWPATYPAILYVVLHLEGL